MKDSEYIRQYIYAMVCPPFVLLGSFFIFKSSPLKWFTFIASVNGSCTVFSSKALWIAVKNKPLVAYKSKIKYIFLIIINAVFQIAYALIIIKTHRSLHSNWVFFGANLIILIIAIRMLVCGKHGHVS